MNDLNAISGIAPKPEGEHKFTFDVKAFFSVTMEAKTEKEARAMVETLDGAEVTLEGQNVILSFDGYHDLTEVDGDDPEDDHIRALKITTEQGA